VDCIKEDLLKARFGIVIGLLFLVIVPLTFGSAVAEDPSDEDSTWDLPDPPPGAAPSCGACEVDDGVRYLTDASVDSIAADLSDGNLRIWAATDSLYRSGAFGRRGSKEAKEQARIHFHLRAATGMTYITRFATGSPLWVNEPSLTRPFAEHYENYGVYPIRFLTSALAGEGGFCMLYDFPPDFDGMLPMGGLEVRAHAGRVRRKHQEIPVFSLELPTSQYKTIDLLYERRFCGKVSAEKVVDRGDTLLVEILQDLDGIAVRRWGTHRMTAIILWRSLTHGHRDPARPRLGGVAYFPHLRLKLPAFLPDLGLQNLRDFDQPNPIFPFQWCRQLLENPVEWISSDEQGNFYPWKAYGPRPEFLEQRFPDL
jgi:hypothetical protein